MKSPWLILCTCTVSLMSSCLPPGQKLLILEIHQAETLVLKTHLDAGDTSTTSEIWDACGESPFSTQVATPALQPTDVNPLRADLIGPVEIKILHVDNLEASASLKNLILMRSSPTADDWRLPAGEIQRAKRASGL